MIEEAMKMLRADRKALIDAGRREYIAIARSVRRETVEEGAPVYSETAPRVKKYAAGERAAAPVARRLKRKLNRAERIARRAGR